jgi:hypothetical protein
MTKRTLQQALPGTRSWEADLLNFRSRFEQSPFLSLNPLYALPRDLIDNICKEMHDWLKSEELQFENDLYTLCQNHHAVGTFCGASANCGVWNRPNQLALSDNEVRRLGWDQQFKTATQVNLAMQEAARGIDMMQQKLEAYCGWLVTNRQFRAELQTLQERWKKAIEKLGRIPTYPVTIEPIAGERTPRRASDVTKDYANDFNSFYDRWELQGLATWDLPQPRGANLSGLPFPPSVKTAPTAVSLQISPILSLPSRLSLNSIVADAQHARMARHLQEWEQVVRQQHDGDLCFVRFRRMFQLHFYRDKVLASRYADRFPGHIEAIDTAFGSFFGGLSSDSIKKLRLQIVKLLHQDA